MHRFSLLAVGAALLSFSASCLASTPGDVTFVNNNKASLASSDALQFQLITNDDGLVTTAVLSAAAPNNQQTLNHWDFSDQTTNFTIYVRDVTKNQTTYTQCSASIPYSHSQPPITVYGSSNGVVAECNVQS